MPVTAETGTLQFASIKDFAQGSAPQFRTNAVLGDVQTTYNTEHGFYNVLLPFTYTTPDGTKEITIKKTISVRLEQFTKPFQTNMKELYTRWNVAKKNFTEKDERKAQFTEDEWRQLWAYTFDIEGILLPLLRVINADIKNIVVDGEGMAGLDCSILSGLTANVNVGPDNKKPQFKAINKVNGKAR